MSKRDVVGGTGGEARGKGWRGTGYFWPIAVVGVLTLSLVICGATLYFAASDESFSVESNYYARAVAWDEHVAELRRSEALGWSVSIGTEAVDVEGAEAQEGGYRRIRLVLRDRDGVAIDDAGVEGVLFHRARRRFEIEPVFTGVGGGAYVATTLMDRAGYWELRLIADRDDGERFLHIAEIVVR